MRDGAGGRLARELLVDEPPDGATEHGGPARLRWVEALERLPPAHREALELVKLEGLSTEAAAARARDDRRRIARASSPGVQGAAPAPRRSAMTMPSTHERTVARLVADTEPVRRLWSPEARLVLWLALPIVAIGAAVIFGLRRDVALELRQPRLLVRDRALHGGGRDRSCRGLARGGARAEQHTADGGLLGRARVRARAARIARRRRDGDGFAVRGERNPVRRVDPRVRRASLGGALRRRAPGCAARRARRRALRGRGRVSLRGAAAVRIACPIDTRLHVLTWHVGTMAIGTALSAVAGARWLARWAD
jgi:hypothetical protein